MFEIVINQLQHYGTDFRSMGLSWSVALCRVPKLFLVLAAPTLCSIFSKIDVNFLTLFFTYSIVIYFMCCTTVNKLECFFFVHIFLYIDCFVHVYSKKHIRVNYGYLVSLHIHINCCRLGPI